MTSRKDVGNRGILIAIEGGDGAGKTTQAERASGYIRGKGLQTLLIREPGGTKVGERVREILLDASLGEMGVWTELFLYMAARAQMVEEVLRPALDAGKVVVTDRFLLSSIVYQGVAGGIGASIVREVGMMSTSGIQPDLTIVLDVEVGEAHKRSGEKKDRMESKDRAFHERVRQGYLEAASSALHKIRVVPASGTVDEVEALVRKEIDRALG